MNELSYGTHSGYGVQMQALLQATFLANVSGRRLVVPPMLSREQMSDLLWHHKFGRACNGPKLAAEGGLDSTQVKLNAESEHVIKRHCKRPAATPFDAFENLFDLNRLVSSRPRACKDGLLCPALHVDMHLGTLRLNRNCTAPKPFTCDDLLGLLFDAPRPPFALLNGPTLCLGALNDWFYTSPGRPATEGTILRRCEQSYPLAMELDRFGLPLRPRIAQAATSFFKEECDGCLYVRLPDDRATPKALAASLRLCHAWSAPTTDQSIHVELVSNCRPVDACAAEASSMLRGPTLLQNNDAAAQNFTKRVNLSLPNGMIQYDQFRCARCSRISTVPQAQNAPVSSFWQQIVRLHRRLKSSEHGEPVDARAGIGCKVPFSKRGS